MAIQRNKLNITKARRRVQMRSALLLTLGACLIVSSVRVLLAGTGTMLPFGLRWLLESGATLLAFGGCAHLGLCVMDGDHAKIVPMQRISRAQLLWLALLGVLAVSPLTLVRGLLAALMGQEMAAGGAQISGSAQFAAMIVKSVLIAPVCEELFFRGYLLPALERSGKLRAALIVSLCFGLVHTAGAAQLASYVLLSLLLCWMALHTQSLLAPIVVHAAYNLTLIVLGSFGLSGLFTGWSLMACTVRLVGCALFAAVLKRAYTARREQGVVALWEGGKLTRRETALLCAAALLILATLVMGG